MPLYDASSPEQKRAALMETGDWRRVFMVKEEFFEFEEDVKEAVLGELPFRVIKRKCADGVQRCVTVQRHRKKRDECVVRYYRDIDFKNPPPGLEETDLKDRGEKGYKVSLKLPRSIATSFTTKPLRGRTPKRKPRSARRPRRRSARNAPRNNDDKSAGRSPPGSGPPSLELEGLTTCVVQRPRKDIERDASWFVERIARGFAQPHWQAERLALSDVLDDLHASEVAGISSSSSRNAACNRR